VSGHLPMLTVLTQNIWGGAPFWRLRRGILARFLARTQPDLVGLQEVHAPDPSSVESQAHELARIVGGYDAVFAAGRITPSGRCEGVAILSRHPVVDREICRLTHDPDDTLDRYGPRIVLRALVETPEGQINTFVAHLSLSRRARDRSVLELVALASPQRARPGLLMGDLNAEPGEPTVGVLTGVAGEWVDAWASANRSGGGTWPAIAPYRRIDYILTRPRDGWAVRDCRRVFTGSDHLGVVARLQRIES
jgi:endonuclease/exonuclease/phosphatase family metal-dependent hydrolase